jgi:predicted dehydrogenase
VIATPDHWHAKATIDAAKAGIHVYCEKPLSLTIAEGRRMVEAVRASGIVLQTGSQQRSSTQFPLACEIVRNGRVGQLLSIEVGVWPGPFELPVPTLPQPATLDWDMWLGQAPVAPYHTWRAARTFRYFHDYAGGALADYGAHELDIAQWGAGYDRSGPTKVRGTATFPAGNFFEAPISFDVNYTYANGVTVHLTTTDDLWFAQFTGTDGVVKVSGAGVEASRPEILEYELGSGETKLAGQGGHYDNWFDAIVNGTRPIADVEIGHRSATMCHLGNIAIALGRELTWDPDAERFVGDDEANTLVSRPQRPPWAT